MPIDLFPAGQSLLVIIGAFLVLFVLVALLFAQERFGATVMAFFRIIASFFTSPIEYLRRAVADLAEYGATGDAKFRTSDQFLINKLLIGLRAIVLLAATAGLAGTLLAAWEALLPPRHLREALVETEQQLASARGELTDVTTKVRTMDDDWNNRRTQLVEEFKSRRREKANAAAADNDVLERSLNADPEGARLLDSIRRYLDNNVPRSTYQAEQVRNSIDRYLRLQSVAETMAADLRKYVDNWLIQRTTQLEIDALNERNLRAEIQPDYNNLMRQQEPLERRVASLESRVASIRGEMKYDPVRMATVLVSGILVLLLMIWGWGLTIEAVSLAVLMAGDIKRIRIAAEERPKAAGAAAGHS